MDDITVYGGIFEECLINLETVKFPDMGEGVSLSLPRKGVPGANLLSSISSKISVPFTSEHVSFCESNLPGGLTTRGRPFLKRVSLPQKGNADDGFLLLSGL